MTPDDPKPAKRLGRVVALLAALRLFRRVGRHRPLPVEADPERERADADFDPSERTVPGNRGAETLVAALLLIAAAFGFAFTAVYILHGNTQLLGIAIGCMLALLAAACIVAGKFVVPQETQIEPRGPLLVEEQAEEVAQLIEEGGEGISRRALLTGAGGVAGAALVTAAAAPVASLGPRLRGIHDTPWQRGVRLVDDAGRLYLASDIEIGSFYTALPEGRDAEDLGAGLLVVRLQGKYLQLPPARQGWAPQGILAYSKICPHAGCAISLYRYPTYQPTSVGPAFTCPCHYSTFSPGEGGKLIFGPAGRSLPQLPLMIDGQGYLRAAGPFTEDIGPSWWNVHRAES
ncbi:MAG: QcrA and Rieske domain-containing protein [Solirubrobacteraceae bacterium]